MVPYKNHMIRARTRASMYLASSTTFEHNHSFTVVFYRSDRFHGLFTGFTDGQREFTDNIRVFGQRFLYGHRIQLFLFVHFASSLYADLPVALTIVHFDGTPNLSLHTSIDKGPNERADIIIGL